jgi:hypothetical protein
MRDKARRLEPYTAARNKFAGVLSVIASERSNPASGIGGDVDRRDSSPALLASSQVQAQERAQLGPHCTGKGTPADALRIGPPSGTEQHSNISCRILTRQD